MVASCCGPGEPPPGPHMLYRVPDGDRAKEMQPTVPVCPISLVLAFLSSCTSIWIIFVPISALAYNKSDARRQLAETVHRMATRATRQLTWAFALKVDIRGAVAWWFTCGFLKVVLLWSSVSAAQPHAAWFRSPSLTGPGTTAIISS